MPSAATTPTPSDLEDLGDCELESGWQFWVQNNDNDFTKSNIALSKFSSIMNFWDTWNRDWIVQYPSYYGFLNFWLLEPVKENIQCNSGIQEHVERRLREQRAPEESINHDSSNTTGSRRRTPRILNHTELSRFTGVSLFRDTIRPEWEDSRNKNGSIVTVEWKIKNIHVRFWGRQNITDNKGDSSITSSGGGGGSGSSNNNSNNNAGLASLSLSSHYTAEQLHQQWVAENNKLNVFWMRCVLMCIGETLPYSRYVNGIRIITKSKPPFSASRLDGSATMIERLEIWLADPLDDASGERESIPIDSECLGNISEYSAEKQERIKRQHVKATLQDAIKKEFNAIIGEDCETEKHKKSLDHASSVEYDFGVFMETVTFQDPTSSKSKFGGHTRKQQQQHHQPYSISGTTTNTTTATTTTTTNGSNGNNNNNSDNNNKEDDNKQYKQQQYQQQSKVGEKKREREKEEEEEEEKPKPIVNVVDFDDSSAKRINFNPTLPHGAFATGSGRGSFTPLSTYNSPSNRKNSPINNNNSSSGGGGGGLFGSDIFYDKPGTFRPSQSSKSSSTMLRGCQQQQQRKETKKEEPFVWGKSNIIDHIVHSPTLGSNVSVSDHHHHHQPNTPLTTTAVAASSFSKDSNITSQSANIKITATTTLPVQGPPPSSRLHPSNNVHNYHRRDHDQNQNFSSHSRRGRGRGGVSRGYNTFRGRGRGRNFSNTRS